MTIDEIINYVIETPENTNPAVLRSMLEQLDMGGSSMSLIPIILYPGNNNSFTYSMSANEVAEGLREGKRYECFIDQGDNILYPLGELQIKQPDSGVYASSATPHGGLTGSGLSLTWDFVNIKYYSDDYHWDPLINWVWVNFNEPD